MEKTTSVNLNTDNSKLAKLQKAKNPRNFKKFYLSPIYGTEPNLGD